MRTTSEFDGWTVTQYRAEIRRLRKENDTLKNPKVGKDGREELGDLISQVGKAITKEQLQAMVVKILESDKPNPLAIREIARMAGLDVSERPKVQTGTPANLIIVRPHKKLLEGDPVAEYSVMHQIGQLRQMEEGN